MTWETKLTPIPPDGEMCADCAFRPDSPERNPAYPGINMEQIKILAEGALAMGFPPTPFLCHAGCPPKDGSYIMPEDPKKLRVCEGWLRLYKNRVPEFYK